MASQLLLQAAQGGGASVTAKKPEEVEAEAKAQILSEGGDLSNERLILSRCKIQFGKYKGQTFKWLLENDVGYTAYIVASHQEQRDHTMCSPLLTANKVLHPVFVPDNPTLKNIFSHYNICFGCVFIKLHNWSTGDVSCKKKKKTRCGSLYCLCKLNSFGVGPRILKRIYFRVSTISRLFNRGHKIHLPVF